MNPILEFLNYFHYNNEIVIKDRQDFPTGRLLVIKSYFNLSP